MNLLKHIPRGKKNRANMEQLMFMADITNKEDFKKELKEVKRENIIIFDDGYYIPEGEEVEDFINKCSARIVEIQHLKELAKKLMK